MKIQLRPDLEEMIKQDIERGPYKTVDEFVERAVFLLHEQEAWLAEQGSEIRTKIEEGHASAQGGELMGSGRFVPSWMRRKRLAG
jgi:putative addiction module CopG family antidote